MATQSMRGLTVFITDVRNCSNKEQERARVDKELANIRTKFKNDRGLTPYERKKYVWKLLYIYMLGYDVEFGHMEALGLISAQKYADKQVGYVVTSVLLNESRDFLRLVINSIRNDLISRNETFQCLALTMVGNIGGKEFAEALSQDVQKLLLSSTARPIVRKKAALCLLRLFRKNSDILIADTWSDQMTLLMMEKDLGVLLGVMNLMIGIATAGCAGYEGCVPKAVAVLERLVRGIDIRPDYTYYGIPSPWLQVATMRVLQLFPVPEDSKTRRTLNEILKRILLSTEPVKNVNKNNAFHAILFEALSLVMHLDSDPDLFKQCVLLLGKFISAREPNIRYLGLEYMGQLALVPDMLDNIKKHEAQVVSTLRDPDISIRRRALDLLYTMCDGSNARGIVEQLLSYLTIADYTIREELALKVAILAEKFATDLSWYIDAVLSLIEKAGEHVSDEIWHRIVVIVTNHEELQEYAASKVLALLLSGAVHETMVKISGYILGEFGHLLQGQSHGIHRQIFTAMHNNFAASSPTTKAMLLSSYIKLMMRAPQDPEWEQQVLAVFKRYEQYADAEIQQRAVEYEEIARMRGSHASMAEVMAEMPKFPERESALVKKMEQQEPTLGDATSTARMRAEKASYRDTFPSEEFKVEPAPAPAPLDTFIDLSDGQPPPPPLQQGPLAPDAAPPPPASSNPMDLLGDLLSAAPDAAVSAPTPAAVVDPFAQASSLDPFMSDQGAIEPIGSVAQWFTKLCMHDMGVLYEDPYIQIGLKSEYAGSRGRLTLYFGNKCSTSPIDVASSSIAPVPGLSVQLGPVPRQFPAQAQLKVPLEVTCVQPYINLPSLVLKYSVEGKTANLCLLLPIVSSVFMVPVSMASSEFFGRWKAAAGPPLKLQETLRGTKPMPVPSLKQLLSKLRLGFIPGLDPNPNNLVAASRAISETGGENFVLVRIETDPTNDTQLRFTVLTDHQYTSLGLKDVLLDQLMPSGYITGHYAPKISRSATGSSSTVAAPMASTVSQSPSLPALPDGYGNPFL
eukprot:jgi/Mesvir1/28287/Mv04810-RA.1